MRIARIIEYFPPHIGGMEGHGLALSFEQFKKDGKFGYDVEVFIGYGGEWKTGFEGIPSDFPIHRMPFQFLPLYSKSRRISFNLYAMAQVMIHHFFKRHYDVIHLHGDFVEARFGGWLSKILKIPTVLTIHAGLNKRLLKPESAVYFKNISKVICVSNEIADDLEKIEVPKEKITIISSGIYLAEFNDTTKISGIAELRNQYSKPILISIGVLRINKGHTYLIEACKHLKQKYASLSLIIIGGGPEENNLKREAKDFGQVHFLGRQNHGKIVENLKAADIFVSSSIDLPQDREGTPTSIMEAMAAGLPIIATRIGGSPYLVKDGINGFLVNPKSAEELEEAITKLIDNSDLAKKMGVQNLEDIKQKNWPVIVQKIDEIYRSVI